MDNNNNKVRQKRSNSVDKMQNNLLKSEGITKKVKFDFIFIFSFINNVLKYYYFNAGDRSWFELILLKLINWIITLILTILNSWSINSLKFSTNTFKNYKTKKLRWLWNVYN